MSHIVDAHVAYIKAIADLSRDKAELLERIKRMEDALRRIANQDYRGNRSTESQIAFEALKEAKL